jgi:hypothetical protein
MTATNGSTAPEVVADLDLEICGINDKIIALVTEEDTLTELKKEAAAEFREKIKGVRKARRDHEKRRNEILQNQLESEATVIIQDSEVKGNA